MSTITYPCQVKQISDNLSEIIDALEWLAWQVGGMSSEQVDTFDRQADDTAGEAYRKLQQAIRARQLYWTAQEELARKVVGCLEGMG